MLSRLLLAVAVRRWPRRRRAELAAEWTAELHARWAAHLVLAPVLSVLAFFGNVIVTVMLGVVLLRPLGYSLGFHGVPYLPGAVVLGLLLAVISVRYLEPAAPGTPTIARNDQKLVALGRHLPDLPA